MSSKTLFFLMNLVTFQVLSGAPEHSEELLETSGALLELSCELLEPLNSSWTALEEVLGTLGALLETSKASPSPSKGA